MTDGTRRPAAVVISVLLFAGYWVVVVIGFWVRDIVRQWPVPLKEPLYLTGWTVVAALALVAVWRGRPRAIHYIGLLGRVAGVCVLVGMLLIHLVFARAGMADTADLVGALPGFLAGAVLLTGGLLLRRREVDAWLAARHG